MINLIIGKCREGKSVLAVNFVKYLTDSFYYNNCIILFTDIKNVESNGLFNSINKQFYFDSTDVDNKIQNMVLQHNYLIELNNVF